MSKATTIILPEIPSIVLVCEGGTVNSPRNIGYSTAPVIEIDESGIPYITKGENDPNILLAELFGHLVSDTIGIKIPRFGVGIYSNGGRKKFASRLESTAMRDVYYFLIDAKLRQTVVNFDMLYKLIALDAWLGNEDRNFGSLLAKIIPNGERIELMVIDFEKSKLFRNQNPIFHKDEYMKLRKWPRDDHELLCSNILDLNKIDVDCIGKLSDEFLENLLLDCLEISGVDTNRKDSILHALHIRKNNLQLLLPVR